MTSEKGDARSELIFRAGWWPNRWLHPRRKENRWVRETQWDAESAAHTCTPPIVGNAELDTFT